MTSASLSDEEIFQAARRINSPEARRAYLDQACGDDAALRKQVEELLAAYEASESFLESPASEIASEIPTRDEAVTERPGVVIGPYKLLQEIGEGGMGVVFMAEQKEPLQRTVALKIIKPGMDTRQVIARFEAERQALAMMDHPNIAKVLDAGTTDSGRPYFVMELVKGVPITQYCDKRHLPLRERLELLLPVCQAVQHAHQKGVIHRDIKPTNVLVAEYDNHAIPKVIDFGVAKATAQKLTERTMFTEFGQLIGTFEYMSPEQAKLNQLDIDTRTDIYSLGVLLYELLTGETPFDRERLRSAAFDEVLRIIREEEPPKPSTRLTTLAQQAGSTISERRSSDAHRLSLLLRGELDWIVMKCLEKNRNRRYETASALAADILHYLHDEPVQAGPPSTLYRFHKFAKRHKAAFLTGAAMVLALLVAVGSLISGVLVLAASNAQVKKEQKQTEEALEREKETSYSRSIALAERQLAAGNVGRAEELLDECPPDVRGWEWRFLKRQRYGNASPLQHPDTVLRVAFSPDGKQLASACLDGAVRIWDAKSGRTLHTVAHEMPIIRALAYSPDGTHLVAGDQDGVVRIWNAGTGELLATLRGHEKTVWQVAFSHDGRTLATASQDGSVRLWQLGNEQANHSHRLIRILAEHPGAVLGIAFTPDGKQLLAACRGGTVKTWDVATGQEIAAFQHRLPYVDNAYFSPDTRRLAWSCQDGTIKVWDTSTGQEQFAAQSNTHFGRSISFLPDGGRIAVAGFDGTIRVMDVMTGREVLTIYAHPSLVSGVAFSPDGEKLASASYDHTVRIWDATSLTDDPLAPYCVSLTGHTQQVFGVAFSADGRWLGSGSLDGTIKVWEVLDVGPTSRARQVPIVPLGSQDQVASGEIVLRHTIREHTGEVIAVAFSPDSKTLASASWDYTVKLWEMSTAQDGKLAERQTILCTERIISLGFSPDGQWLAVGLQNGIAVYDVHREEAEIHSFKSSRTPVPALTFTPDSRRLVSVAATDASIKFWDVTGEKQIFEIRHHSNPNSAVAVSPDGRRIASASRNHAAGEPAVKIWEVDWEANTTKEIRALKGHAAYIWRVAYSPDGRYLASGSWDSTIKVWDLAAPESAEPVTLRGHAGFIRSLAFSPDGRRLASASGYAGQGEVKIWDAALWDSARAGRDSVATSIERP